MKLFVASLLLLLVVSLLAPIISTSSLAQFVQNSCPPSGYDTYDFQPIWADLVPTEATALQQAEALYQYRKLSGGWYDTLILDEGWADIRLNNLSYIWTLTPNGIPTPIVKNFPSAADGRGLTSLAETLKSKYGMKLGVWHVKGVPRVAVEKKMPIAGTNYTCDQIITAEKLSCSWHKDVYDVDPSHPGGQAYYDSIVDLWAQWGITYLKIDCIFGSDLRMTEIVAYSNAVKKASAKYGIDITLSISPGFLSNRTTLAPLLNTSVNLARVTDDLWDCWGPSLLPAPGCLLSSVSATVWTLIYFQPFLNTVNQFGTPFRPDPDMIPIAKLNLLYPHFSSFTGKMLRFIFGMWTITLSPIILGGDLTTIPDAKNELPILPQLLGNPDLKDMHCSGANPRVIYSQAKNISSDKNVTGGEVVWALDRTQGGVANKFQVYVGFFPFDPFVIDHDLDVNATSRKILWSDIGLDTMTMTSKKKKKTNFNHKKNINNNNVFENAFYHNNNDDSSSASSSGGSSRDLPPIPVISTYDVLNRKIGPQFNPATTDGFTLTSNVNDATIWLVMLNE